MPLDPPGRPAARPGCRRGFEVFNLLNTTNFDQPDAFLGSPTFGQILSAGSPRRMQLGVRVLF